MSDHALPVSPRARAHAPTTEARSTKAILIAVSLMFLGLFLVFPVLVVFGVMGYHWARGRRWATWLYVAYWLGLTAMAVVHLAVRARMVA